MAISKITLNGVTQMDVTGKTVTAGTMLNNVTALKNDGTDIVGDILSQAGSFIISEECDDILEGKLRNVNGNYNNAYYTWSEGVCTVSTPNGAVSSSGSVYQLLTTSPGELPASVHPGENYYVTCDTTSANVRLRIVFRDSSDNNISPEHVFTESGKITIPANAVSWVVQIHVAPNTLLTQPATIGDIHIYAMEEAVPSGKYTEGDVIVAVASSEHIGSDVPRQAAQTIHPSASDQTIASGKYLEGNQTINKVLLKNLLPENIKSGMTVKVGDEDDDDCVAAVTGTMPVNIVTGKFTGTTAGAAMDVDIPYTGSGYPIAVIIYPTEGCYNSAGSFYSTVNQYACAYFFSLKTMPGTAPTYTTGTNNNSQTINRYKSSTSDSTALATSSGHVNNFRDINASAGTGAVMEIRSATKMSVFIKNTSYGFAKDVEYTYHVIYSE